MASGTPHVLIVGGGVLGCATAYRLARAGLRVTLVEPDEFGDHASGKNAGNLNPFLNTPEPLVPLALDSFRQHRALAAELGDAGYTLAPVQRLLLAFDAADIESLEREAGPFRDRDGFSAQKLDVDEVYRREPRLGPGIRMGLLITGNLSVDSRAFTPALARAAAHFGATLIRDRVREIESGSGNVREVRTTNERICCDTLVLATGPWTAEMPRWFGVSLPIEPVKGQLLRLSLPGAELHYDLTHNDISLYRRGSNEVWLGVTRERAGLDEMPTPEARAALMAHGTRLFPGVAQATLLEHCASLRPLGPGGLPLVGSLPGWDNVYIINGGGIKGVLLSAGMSLAIHDLIRFGHTAVPIHFPDVWRQALA